MELISDMRHASFSSSLSAMSSGKGSNASFPHHHFDQQMPRWIYYGIMLSMTIVAAIVISFNVDTAAVIQLAQVVNGSLLPLFAFCLLLCINDESFMKHRPQPWWANVLLILAVTITLILALNSIIGNILKSWIDDGEINENVPLYVAAGLAPLVMAAAIFFTGLWRDIVRSFKLARCFKKSS